MLLQVREYVSPLAQELQGARDLQRRISPIVAQGPQLIGKKLLAVEIGFFLWKLGCFDRIAVENGEQSHRLALVLKASGHALANQSPDQQASKREGTVRWEVRTEGRLSGGNILDGVRTKGGRLDP